MAAFVWQTFVAIGSIGGLLTGLFDVPAAVILAITMFVGTWIGAFAANKIAGPYLRLMFGVFVWVLGGYLIFGASRRLGWL